MHEKIEMEDINVELDIKLKDDIHVILQKKFLYLIEQSELDHVQIKEITVLMHKLKEIRKSGVGLIFPNKYKDRRPKLKDLEQLKKVSLDVITIAKEAMTTSEIYQDISKNFPELIAKIGVSQSKVLLSQYFAYWKKTEKVKVKNAITGPGKKNYYYLN